MHPGKSIRVPYRTLLNQPHERIRQHLHAGRRYERADHAIKDTIDIAAYRTTAASGALANAPPAQRHATVVERVLAAGWCIVGKTNMHELAFGMTGINAFTGTPQNPQDATLIPGGSSSGSAAAVGLHLADAALGTDTGGSVRGPAACCGVIGFKPTFGRVSRRRSRRLKPCWIASDRSHATCAS
jgi:Asp-tRNA(Asn)/Glu-tRNA(Gln) amidotransferase A subunit family amidase